MYFFFSFLNLVARSAGLSKGYIPSQDGRHLQSPGLLTSSKAASPFVKKRVSLCNRMVFQQKWCVPLFTGKQLSRKEKDHTDLSLCFIRYTPV